MRYCQDGSCKTSVKIAGLEPTFKSEYEVRMLLTRPLSQMKIKNITTTTTTTTTTSSSSSAVVIGLTDCLHSVFEYKLPGSLFVKVSVSSVSWSSTLSFLSLYHGPAHYNIQYNSISHNTIILIIIIIIPHFTAVNWFSEEYASR